jgi:hypothetical protein
MTELTEEATQQAFDEIKKYTVHPTELVLGEPARKIFNERGYETKENIMQFFVEIGLGPLKVKL